MADSFTITRTLVATPETVWEVWTTPEFDDAQVEATVAGYKGFFDAMERVIEELRLTP